MTDAEWAVIEPLLPAPGWLASRGGCPGTYCRRDIADAIRYLVHNGCVWRALPADLPHWRTVYGYVRAWQASGATRKMHDELRGQVRLLAGRSISPTAAVIDSQSVKGADTVGKASRGYDAGKKIEGRKRHIATDTLGLILVIVVTAASVQDRDAARHLLWRLAAGFRHVSLIWADGGYAGKLVTWAARHAAPHPADRQAPRQPAHIQAAAPPLGCRAHIWMDHEIPAVRPRLRTPARTPRNLPLLVHDHRHGTPRRPPPQNQRHAPSSPRPIPRRMRFPNRL